MRVAVVGAGAAGLAVLKSLVSSSWASEVRAFEASDCVGGSWVYRDEGETTAMYENMRTNLPKDCMGFLDQQFSNDLPTFMGHQEVRQYLEEYAQRHQLHKQIHFRCSILAIEPTNTTNPHTGSWLITWEDNSSKKRVTEEFDRVVICNGHYSAPYYPTIPGLANFRGTVLHSNQYRNNKAFKGKTVVLHGNGASAADIGMEIAVVASQVHQCKRLDSAAPFKYKAKGITSQGNIIEVKENGNLLLEDDTELENADVLIFCTGFHYEFPFLDLERCQIQLEYKRVCGLLYHIFPFTPCHPHYYSDSEDAIQPPTIAFVGLPWKVIPFPLFDVQARYVSSVWSGSTMLPCAVEIRKIMQEEIEFQESANLPAHYLHCLGVSQFVYCRKLLDLAGFPELRSLIDKNRAIGIATKYVRLAHPHYKDFTLKIQQNGKWKYFPPESGSHEIVQT